MTDEELDELILSRLRNRATQSATDLAASFNEPEARVLALASKGRIEESGAMPGRWMIA